MLSTRTPISQENKLWLSWHDSALIPILNPTNIMDYFSQKSNPFYDRNCNNETLMMQRISLDQLKNMTGVEYILLHVHEPILYVVRKQHRHTINDATPLADYYIIAGVVYQAPDLGNVFNSRILSCVTHLQSAFEEASQYSRYHPNKGYTWDFSSNKALSEKSKATTKKESNTTREEPGTLFQRQRVDMLLGDLLRKFPPPMPPQIQQQAQVQINQQQSAANANAGTSSQQIKTEQNQQIDSQTQLQQIKQEPVEMNAHHSNNPSDTTANMPDQKIDPSLMDMKPPPEKKMKINDKLPVNPNCPIVSKFNVI
ncbi:mediator of RNA polymerase II transcription subunit 6 [Condylostylus longicornis]|uniref:mediator of RNA polymerase II transcription subunit 6 n=1 Tax=Condylostylus longicornis TaxID=2530218 RepID=UPI00244E4EE5|nr:mediator of RNA polymerase II transcription subunit 6 [Condylostylus longicornis]